MQALDNLSAELAHRTRQLGSALSTGISTGCPDTQAVINRLPPLPGYSQRRVEAMLNVIFALFSSRFRTLYPANPSFDDAAPSALYRIYFRTTLDSILNTAARRRGPTDTRCTAADTPLKSIFEQASDYGEGHRMPLIHFFENFQGFGTKGENVVGLQANPVVAHMVKEVDWVFQRFVSCPRTRRHHNLVSSASKPKRNMPEFAFLCHFTVYRPGPRDGHILC